MRRFWAIVLLSLCSLSVFGETERVTTGEFQFGLSVGFGGREVPIRGIDNVVVPAVPHIQYYSDDWYFDDFSVGYNLIEADDLLIDLVGTFNHDGFYFELDGLTRFLAEPGIRDKPRPWEPPPPEYVASEPIERNLSYLGGLGITMPLSFATLSGGIFTDISGVHHGEEARLALIREEVIGRWQLGFEVGLTYKTKEIANYYFVQRPGEFLTRVAAPELDELLNRHLKFSAQYWLNENVSIGARVTYELLDKELKRSTIIDQRELVSGFVGITRWF